MRVLFRSLVLAVGLCLAACAPAGSPPPASLSSQIVVPVKRALLVSSYAYVAAAQTTTVAVKTGALAGTDATKADAISREIASVLLQAHATNDALLQKSLTERATELIEQLDMLTPKGGL